MYHRFVGERVLVTGASGFIGRHLLAQLHAEGADVTALVTTARAHQRPEGVPSEVRTVTVEDVTRMCDVVRDVCPRHVVHLNACITLQRSLDAVQHTIEANLVSTINLLAACTEVKVDRVVLMGSCEEYGQKFCPFDTALATDPNSPYGASKAAATAYARMFYGSFGLPTVVLRPSVVYGPGQSLRQLVPAVLQALMEGKQIPVTAGRQTRDFVFIDDMIEAILLSLKLDNIAGEVWNIGSGEVVTVRECLELIEEITGRTGLIQYGARPYAESERFHYEPIVEGTFNAFGWRPSTMLKEGLRRTWQATLSQNAKEHGKTP